MHLHSVDIVDILQELSQLHIVLYSFMNYCNIIYVLEGSHDVYISMISSERLYFFSHV